MFSPMGYRVLAVKCQCIVKSYFRTDKVRPSTIQGKRKAEYIVDEIQSYKKKNWLQNIKRMEHLRKSRIALEYKPEKANAT
jgi:hypothetical protein